MSTLANADRLATDPQLRRYTGLYIYLAERLDPVEYRAVKFWYVAQRLHCQRQTVARGVRALVALRLLERGPITGRGASITYTYRLIGAPTATEELSSNRTRLRAS